jgi:hypothetical protein
MSSLKLISDQQLADALGLEVKNIRWLRKNHRIPAIKLGYRTFKYRLDDVEAAIMRREIKAVGLKGSK